MNSRARRFSSSLSYIISYIISYILLVGASHWGFVIFRDNELNIAYVLSALFKPTTLAYSSSLNTWALSSSMSSHPLTATAYGNDDPKSPKLLGALGKPNMCWYCLMANDADTLLRPPGPRSSSSSSEDGVALTPVVVELTLEEPLSLAPPFVLLMLVAALRRLIRFAICFHLCFSPTGRSCFKTSTSWSWKPEGPGRLGGCNWKSGGCGCWAGGGGGWGWGWGCLRKSAVPLEYAAWGGRGYWLGCTS